jgi:hypothetical protein
MLVRHSRLIAAASALLLTLASTAGAAVLWDQSNWDPAGEGSVNLSSNSCSQISGNTKVHTANDVHFDSPAHITTVRIYETLGNVQTATLAYLWIHPKSGSLPTTSSDSLEILTLGVLQVPITSATQTIGTSTAAVVTATGLNINLPAGDYWVSLTPRHNLGIFPYSVHLITSGPVMGDPTAAILVGRADAPSCAPVNSNWYYPLDPNRPDYAIKIEGDFPVATMRSSWGRVKQIYR